MFRDAKFHVRKEINCSTLVCSKRDASEWVIVCIFAGDVKPVPFQREIDAVINISTKLGTHNWGRETQVFVQKLLIAIGQMAKFCLFFFFFLLYETVHSGTYVLTFQNKLNVLLSFIYCTFWYILRQQVPPKNTSVNVYGRTRRHNTVLQITTSPYDISPSYCHCFLLTPHPPPQYPALENPQSVFIS